jgi:hypothetical protein
MSIWDKIMTHNDLVKKAVVWLKTAQQCNPVFSERGSARIPEVPDAIGFTSTESIVVEVKVSKGDLMADKKKLHRTNGDGMGNRRYYLMPEDIYQECKGNDWRGWGVAVWSDRSMCVRQVRGMSSKEFSSNIQKERDFLRSRILEVQRFGR